MSSVAAREWYAKNKITLIPQIQPEHEVFWKTTELREEESPKGIKIDFYFFYTLVLILAISYILVQSTADVIGKDFTGYLKAISLEMGILLLTFLSPKSILDKLFKFIVLGVSFFLTFFILHSGATIGAAESHKTIEQNNIELVNLTELRSRLLSNHDALPANYTSKRNVLISQITEIDEKISNTLASTKQSPAVTALNAATDTEIWSRAVFLLMNLFFTHQLAQRLRSRLEVTA